MRSELTGRRRYRLGLVPPKPLQPNLVLQVEVSEWNDTAEGKPGRWVCVWRDATRDDVQSEELIE